MTQRRQRKAANPTKPTATAIRSSSSIQSLDEAEALLADREGPAALADARQLLGAADSSSATMARRKSSQRSRKEEVAPLDAPHLGIFWFVRDCHGQTHVLTVTCALTAAEQYGDCLTCPAGHYLTWAAWRRGRPKPPLPALAPLIVSTEYESWPRSRIVYERPPDRFIIYADHQLLTGRRVAQIRNHFHLSPERTAARSNFHYRSTRSIGRC